MLPFLASSCLLKLHFCISHFFCHTYTCIHACTHTHTHTHTHTQTSTHTHTHTHTHTTTTIKQKRKQKVPIYIELTPFNPKGTDHRQFFSLSFVLFFFLFFVPLFWKPNPLTVSDPLFLRWASIAFNVNFSLLLSAPLGNCPCRLVEYNPVTRTRWQFRRMHLHFLRGEATYAYKGGWTDVQVKRPSRALRHFDFWVLHSIKGCTFVR